MNNNTATDTSTPSETNVVAFPAPKRTPIRELIEKKILDNKAPSGEIITSQARYEDWLERHWTCFDVTIQQHVECWPHPGRGTVRSRSAAKCMIATWIEYEINAQDGVFFGKNDKMFTLGLKGRPPINVLAPAWVTDYINSFPNLSKPLTPEEILKLDEGTRRMEKAEAEWKASRPYRKAA